MKPLLQWVGALVAALAALAVISPPVAAQLNRIAPRQIVCAVGSVLVGGNAGMSCAATLGVGTAPVTGSSLYITNGTLKSGIRIQPTAADAHQPMMLLQKTNGTITGGFDEAGNFHTNLSIFVSGAWATTLNADGSVASVTSGVSGQSDMIDVVGDTTFGVLSKGSTTPGELYTGMDQSGNFVWDVAPLGCNKWGTGNFAAMDTGLCRTAATELSAGNGTAGDTSGTFRGIFRNNAATITSTAATTPAFGTNFVGGAGGPTTGAQNGWIVMKDSAGASIWIPVWK